MISETQIKYLSFKCSIDEHPISSLPKDMQQQYVRGLYYLVQYYGLKNKSFNHSFLMVLLNQWCTSIIGEDVTVNNTTIEDAKRALSLQRIGWKFFRMKRDLFFDFFYLLSTCCEASNFSVLESVYCAVKNDVAGVFTKGALSDVFNYFCPSQGRTQTSEDKLPATQLQHLRDNYGFLQQPLKKVLFVANVSAGKSTLINALVGSEINKVKTTACTSQLNYLFSKPCEDGMTILVKGNDSQYDYSYYDLDNESFDYGATWLYSMLGGYRLCLIDTPGINNAEDLSHGRITSDAINNNDYDLVVYVSNCRYFGTDDERSILTKIIKKSKSPIIFCLNQLDTFKQKEDSIDKMLRDYTSDLRKMGIKDPIVVPISAEAAYLEKIDILLHEDLDEDTLFDVEQYKKRFSKDFYNLPKYSNLPQDYQIDRSDDNIDMLDKTGIFLLENTIINTLQLN